MSKLALLFFGSYFSLIIAAFIASPSYAFYLYEIVYFTNPESRWWGNNIPDIKYSFIAVFVILLTYISSYSKHQNNTLAQVPQKNWLILLVLSFIFASFVAVDKESHVTFLIEYMKMIVTVYLAFKIIDSPTKLDWAVFFYFIGAAYVGYEAFIIGRNEMGRVEGIGMVDSRDANTTAASLIPTIPLLIYYIWIGDWRKRALLTILALFILNGLILMNSRGAFLGICVGVLYFLAHMAFTKYKIARQRIMLILICIAIALSIFRLTDKVFWQRMDTITTQSSIESAGSGGRRINFWLATFDMLEDYPLGIGIQGYQKLSTIYLDNEEYFSNIQGHKRRAVHSIWFQGLAEVGLHGFIFFVMLLFGIKKHFIKTKKHLLKIQQFERYYLAIALEASCLSFLAASTFIDMFRVQILYWLILFSIVFCVCSLKQTKNNDKTDKSNKTPIEVDY